MTPLEAEKIINSYGGTIASEKVVARRKSSLPCSKARIKYAFFVYIEELIMRHNLEQQLGIQLVNAYSLLSSFIDDTEVDEINSSNGELKVEFAQKTILNKGLREELENFIEECYEKY